MAFAGVTSPVFVGRDAELAVLTDVVRQVRTGQARAVLVGGEAGMGKSRLVAEAAAMAERAGFRVLVGHCVELGADGMALVPLVEALRTLARTTRPDELEALLGPARVELSRLLPELAPGEWQEPRTMPASTGQLLELVLTRLARSLAHVRDLEAARRVAQSAVDAAREVGDGEMEADALITLGTAEAYVGDVDRALAALRAGRERASELGIHQTALRGYINESDVLELAGRHAEAVETAEKGIALATRVGLNRTYGAYLTGNLIDSLLRLGRWDDADRAAQDAMIGAPEGVFAATLLQARAEIAVGAGRNADAAAHALEVRRLLGDISDDQFLQPLARTEAELARAEGDLAAARGIVAAGLDGALTLSGRYAWPLAWMGMRVEADQAIRARDLRRPVPPDIAARAGELAGTAAELPVRTPEARAYQALLAAEHARLEAAPAPAEWAAAVASCRQSGEPYVLSYALLRLASDAFAAGDRETGTTALHEAAELADRIGAAPLAEEAVALARRARVSLAAETAPAAPESADPLAHFGLTDREGEILRLVAVGLSNGQIAAELFISPKTASVHVSRMLAKLGVSGRVEAAAVAHRLGSLAPEVRTARS